jgi:hypothetical protein
MATEEKGDEAMSGLKFGDFQLSASQMARG